MYEWILPSLSEILAETQSSVAECSPAQAERQWRVSLAATEHLLLNTLKTTLTDASQGLVLAAPAPLFSEPKLTQSLQTVTFTAKPFNPLALMPFQMPPGSAIADEVAPQESVLPLLPADPLASEQFCLVFTEKFRLVLVLAESRNGKKAFSFSFEPEVVQQAWRSLGARVMLTNPEFFAELDAIAQKYYPVAPDYHTVIQFGQLLATNFQRPGALRRCHTVAQFMPVITRELVHQHRSLPFATLCLTWFMSKWPTIFMRGGLSFAAYPFSQLNNLQNSDRSGIPLFVNATRVGAALFTLCTLPK